MDDRELVNTVRDWIAAHWRPAPFESAGPEGFYARKLWTIKVAEAGWGNDSSEKVTEKQLFTLDQEHLVQQTFDEANVPRCEKDLGQRPW